LGTKADLLDATSVRHAYRRWAPVYDFTFGTVAEAGRKHAVKIINRRRGRVLEVGVGTGLSLPCYEKHLTVTGIDLSPDMLRKARSRVERQRLTNVAGLHEMDAGALAFRDEIDGVRHTFYGDPASPETAPFKDRETETRWTLAGRAVKFVARPIGESRTWLDMARQNASLAILQRLSAQATQELRMAALQEFLGFFPSVAAEVRMQKIDHRPEVTAFLDVDLEQVPQVVERRTRETQVPLLFDGCRLGVALRDNQAAQIGAIFAGHFLPRGLALVRAEVDFALRVRRRQENSPAIVLHLHVVEVRPALGLDAHGGAQVDVQIAGLRRSRLGPPALELGLPLLESALQRPVAREVDVVRNLFGVIDAHRFLSQEKVKRGPSRSAPCCRNRTLSARLFHRWHSGE